MNMTRNAAGHMFKPFHFTNTAHAKAYGGFPADIQTVALYLQSIGMNKKLKTEFISMTIFPPD